MKHSARTTHVAPLARRVLAAAVVAVAAMGVLAVPSMAADGDPLLNSCQTITATAPCTAGSKGSTWGTAVSPDGKMVVFSTYNNGDGALVEGLQIYTRNTTTGELAYQGCISASGNGGACAVAAGVVHSIDATFSPDGRSLYTAQVDSGSIAVFERDPNANTLTFTECFGALAGCTAVTGGIPAPYSVVADNSTVYVRGSDTLTVFTRGTAANHPLTQKAAPGGCFTEEAVAQCTNAVGLGGGANADMGLTANHLYVSNGQPGGVAMFNRASDGTLTQLTGTSGGCITSNGTSGAGTEVECIDGADQLANARSANVDPTGSTVYVGGGNGIIGYSRNNQTGVLTQSECVVEASPPAGCKDGQGVSSVFRMAFTSDGSELITGGYTSGAVAFFQRNTGTGALTQRSGKKGCFSADGSGGACEQLPTSIFLSPAVAPGDLDVYLNSHATGLVAHVERDFAPACQAKSVNVPFQTSAVVQFSCTDVNGDAQTFAISKQPTNGSLLAIDQGAATVRYNPALAFAGGDEFEYTATARGVTSAPAKVTLNVQPPVNTDADGDGVSTPTDCNDNNPAIRPNAVDTPGNGVDENCDGKDATIIVNAGISHSWIAFPKFTRVVTLAATKVPRNGKVRVTCKGKGCPFKTRTVTSKKGGTVGLTKFFNRKKKGSKRVKKAKLRLKAKITIQVTLPNAIGYFSTFTVRANAIPKRRQGCLAVNSTSSTRCPAA